MIEPIDLMTYASRQGLVLNYSIVKEALALLDRTTLEEIEKKRYSAKIWDGTDAPPVGQRDRWLHGNDGVSRAAIESTNAGGIVYWLFRDDKMILWQPYRADKAGRVYMVTDPNHPDHYQTAIDGHIAKEVESGVDEKMLRLGLDKALTLHETRNVPINPGPGVTRRPR
jgi:hypothetical protein